MSPQEINIKRQEALAEAVRKDAEKFAATLKTIDELRRAGMVVN